MPDKLSLDPKTSALLVMDFQTAVVEMVAADKDALLPRAVGLIDAARMAGMHGDEAPGQRVRGTDLDMILRANGIDTLVLGGIATSGVVLSTVRHAADADYRLVVVADFPTSGGSAS
ncbi:MAG: cysteine hydrolase family protein [Polyangiaceae bacterium]